MQPLPEVVEVLILNDLPALSAPRLCRVRLCFVSVENKRVRAKAVSEKQKRQQGAGALRRVDAIVPNNYYIL